MTFQRAERRSSTLPMRAPIQLSISSLLPGLCVAVRTTGYTNTSYQTASETEYSTAGMRPRGTRYLDLAALAASQHSHSARRSLHTPSNCCDP